MLTPMEMHEVRSTTAAEGTKHSQMPTIFIFYFTFFGPKSEQVLTAQ